MNSSSTSINYMEYYSNNPSYTVTEVQQNGMLVQSYFKSLKDAKSFSKKYTELSSTAYIFKTYCTNIYEPENEFESEPEICDEESTDSMYFDGMVLTQYGRGYLLKPPMGDKNHGEKYFHNGWWISMQNGWFFKSDQYDMLIRHGAILMDESATYNEDNLSSVSKVSTELDTQETTPSNFLEDTSLLVNDSWGPTKQLVSDYESTDSEYTPEDDMNIDTTEDLSSMVFKSYGKGYLLIPKTDSTYIGEKYLYEGWWVEKRQGWFFKRDYYEWLINQGAVEITDFIETTKTEHTVDENLSSMCFERYKKGYMLYSTKNDSRFMKDYFLEGFWNKNTQGWFFKKQYYEVLIQRGAKYIKSEYDECSEDTVVSNTSNSSRVTRSSHKQNVNMKYDY